MAKMDFQHWRIKHRAWRTKLKSFLDGEETLTREQATSHRDCGGRNVNRHTHAQDPAAIVKSAPTSSQPSPSAVPLTMHPLVAPRCVQDRVERM